METLKNIFAEGNLVLIEKIAIMAGIILGAFIIERLCRKFVIPAIRKIASRTESILDDHLLSNEVLNNICSLITPIIIYS
jgi:miniconductance mechanosensitive channel